MSLLTPDTGEVTERTICGFRVHPVADEFPFIKGDRFDAFVADIKEFGQREPIVLDREGRLIDGRNRARACEQLEIAPKTRHYNGTDVVEFITSENLHRRDLTDSQRAMIAARIATRGHGKHGKVFNIEDLPPSTAEAAALLSVGLSSVSTAKRLVRDGTKGLQGLASDGVVPIATAARVAEKLDAEGQDEYVAKVRAGADPIKAAPINEKQRKWDAQRNAKKKAANQAKPSAYGNRRRHVAQLDALIVALDGATAAFEGISADAFDHSLTPEEAARITGDLSVQIRSLNRINNAIKELTR